MQANSSYSKRSSERMAAIDRNRQALVSNAFWGKLESCRGEYALMRDGEIVEILASVHDALLVGARLFPNDYRYSVERLDDSPIFMGMASGLIARSA